MKRSKALFSIIIIVVLFLETIGFSINRNAIAEANPVFLGMVCDSDHNAIPGVAVAVFKSNEDVLKDTPILTVATDSTGTWEAKGLQYGCSYTLVLSKNGYAFHPSEIEICEMDSSIHQTRCEKVIGKSTAVEPAPSTAHITETQYAETPVETPTTEATEQSASIEPTASVGEDIETPHSESLSETPDEKVTDQTEQESGIVASSGTQNPSMEPDDAKTAVSTDTPPVATFGPTTSEPTVAIAEAEQDHHYIDEDPSSLDVLMDGGLSATQAAATLTPVVSTVEPASIDNQFDSTSEPPGMDAPIDNTASPIVPSASQEENPAPHEPSRLDEIPEQPEANPGASSSLQQMEDEDPTADLPDPEAVFVSETPAPADDAEGANSIPLTSDEPSTSSIDQIDQTNQGDEPTATSPRISISVDPMFAKTGDTVTLTATVTGCEGALFQWQWTAIPADVLAGMTVTAAPSGSEEAILVSGEQSAALMWVDEPGATALTYSFVGTEETLNRYWRLMVTLPQGASKDGAQSTPENTVPDNAGNGSQGAEQNVVQAAEEGGTQNAPEGAAQGTEEDAAPGGAAPDGAEAAPAENEKYTAPGLSLAPLGSILCALLVGSAKAESDTVITSEGYASVLRTDTGAGQAETFTSLDKPLPAYVKAADTGLYPSPDESGAPLAALAENECVTVCATGESWAYVSTPTFPEGYLRLDAIRFLADDPAAAPSNSGQSAGALSLSDFGLSAEDTAVPAESAASSLLQVSRMAVSVTSAALPSYLHPQTLVVSEDNESNAHTGTPDGDIDQYLYNYHIITPIEVRFTIATLPARSAHLALYTWDCDETNGDEPEYDAVYVNGHKVGVLTGENNKWNTTLISVPIDYLSLGANYVTVHIGKRNLNTGAIYEDFDYWAIRVKWMQLLLDGGQADSDTETFTVELQDASLTGERIDCRTHVTIVSASARTYEVEYSLVDHTSEATPSYLQIISSDDNTVTGSNLDDYGTLSFSLSAASGEYVVQVLLRDAATQAILATDEAAFDFITGVVPSFDISMLLATQDPYEYTEGPVTLFLSA